MPWFIFALFFNIALKAIRECIAKTRKTKPAPLCADCFLRARAVRGECTACDLLYVWWRSASDEVGRAVLYRLPRAQYAASERGGFRA